MSESSQYTRRATDAQLPDSPSAAVADLPAAQITLLDPQGQPARTVALTADGLTIGSRPDSGLALDATTVARNHARIDWDGRQAVVTALGTRGDTLLDTRRLAPQQPQVWAPGQVLQIGPYALQIAIAAPATQPIQPATTARLAAAPALQPFAPAERVAISLAPGQEYMELVPGQLMIVSATVANYGDAADTVRVTVEGLPVGWFMPTQSLLLEPGGRAIVPLTISVPEVPASLAGEYAVTVRARSIERPAEVGLAYARWLVLPFAASRLELTPQRARGREQAIYTAHISNLGNAPATYTLHAEDDEQALSCSFAHPQIEVAPGETVDMPLTVHAQRRAFGQPRRYDFLVHASDEIAVQTVEGQFVQEGLFPIWTIPAAIALLLLVLLCGFGAFPGPASAWSGVPFYGALAAVPAPTLASTQVAQTVIAQNTAQIAAQQTVVGALQVAQSTIIAAPAVAAAADNTAVAQAQATATAAQAAITPPSTPPPFLLTPIDTQPGGAATSPTATPTEVVFPTTGVQPSAETAATSTPIEGAQLVFVIQPSDATGGSDFSTHPQIYVRDANGDVVTDFNDDITIAIDNNPGDGTLDGDLTVAAVSGIATFSRLSIDKVGAGYTLVASSNALTSAPSDSFDITVGSPSEITVTGEATQSTPINHSFDSPLEVTVWDAGGNPVPGAVVTFIGPSTGASFTPNNTVRTTDDGGVASVNVAANGTEGRYPVTASINSSLSATFDLTNEAIPTAIPTRTATSTANTPTATTRPASTATATTRPTNTATSTATSTATHTPTNTPTATVIVGVAPPTVNLTFNPTTIKNNQGSTPAGQTTLTIIIGNPNPTAALTGVSFAGTLPGKLKMVNTNPVQSNGCGAGLVAVPGTEKIALTGASLAGGASCTIALTIRTGSGTPNPPPAGRTYTFTLAASATNSTPATGAAGSADITVVR
jgi:hypothetical protein